MPAQVSIGIGAGGKYGRVEVQVAPGKSLVESFHIYLRRDYDQHSRQQRNKQSSKS